MKVLGMNVADRCGAGKRGWKNRLAGMTGRPEHEGEHEPHTTRSSFSSTSYK